MTDDRGARSPGRVAKARDFLIIMIRHKLPFLYPLLDRGNNLYGRLFFRRFKDSIRSDSFAGARPADAVRVLKEGDVPALLGMILGASEEDRRLFRPHPLTERTFGELMRAPYYLAVGYYAGDELAGYAFLRLYFPRKAFAGYFVSGAHQGKGIGKALFGVLKTIARDARFALYTYVNEENLPSIRVSADYTIEQRIPGGYLVLKHNLNERGEQDAGNGAVHV